MLANLRLFTSFTWNRIVTNRFKLSTSQKLHALKEYLVEFRGIAPTFRELEFQHAFNHVLGNEAYPINFRSIITESASNYSMCSFVLLPNDKVAADIISRCSLTRSIIEVWGIGKNIDEVKAMLEITYPTYIKPIFHPDLTSDKKSWKVQFRRHGRSIGPDNDRKRAILDQFSDMLSLGGPVDLNSPAHNLIYLEDWNRYQQELNHWGTLGSDKPPFLYEPSTYLFGRIVGEGVNIQHIYDIRNRPYLGSTTMDEISSHIAASAAYLKPGDLVLDPFCGTGSLLIACAHFGAHIVGSDVDGAGLGVIGDSDRLPYAQRSKHTRFQRTAGHQSQANLTTHENFVYYNITDRVCGWIGTDIANWLLDDVLCNATITGNQDMGSMNLGITTVNINDFPQFDAIVTDPPFGIRERALGLSAKSEAGDSITSTAYLFAVAIKRLKPGGRLVFYLPTSINSDRTIAQGKLQQIEILSQQILSDPIYHDGHLLAESASYPLQLESLTESRMHSSLSRWLCVYQKPKI